MDLNCRTIRTGLASGVRGLINGLITVLVVGTLPPGQLRADVDFVRGDANRDAAVDLSDGVAILGTLFLGRPIGPCPDLLDVNDSGAIDLSDAAFVFNFLFTGGEAIPSPHPSCGADPTADGLGCEEYEHCDGPGVERPNILLVIADDFGVDAARCYSTGSVAPMPNLESLCARGVVFDNAWSMPVCAPTRAALLTGRYGLRTGIDGLGTGALSLSELSIPRALDQADSGYDHACFGKWHLGGRRGATHPNDIGFSRYAGALGGGVNDYESWTKTTDGLESTSTTYATTDAVDDAIEWIGERQAPWLLWLAFNAPHTPFHLPPAHLHSAELPGGEADINARPREYYDAAVEAMDTELGRLLDSISAQVLARTVVIFIGDNGSPARVARAPARRGRAKDSLYQGGVNVPFVVAGPVVADGGRRSDALLDVTDIFATVLELAGVDLAASLPPQLVLDSRSIVPYLGDPDAEPRREFVFAELFGMAAEDRQGRTIRDSRYKLIDFELGGRELYDIVADPAESVNLLASPLGDGVAARLEALDAALDALVGGATP